MKEHHIIGCAVVVAAVGYMLLHQRAPSAMSLPNSRVYPVANSIPDIAVPETPGYLAATSQVEPSEPQLDLSGEPLRAQMSEDNFRTAIVTDSSAVE